jgi:hypothetical protein
VVSIAISGIASEVRRISAALSVSRVHRVMRCALAIAVRIAVAGAASVTASPIAGAASVTASPIAGAASVSASRAH